jgi:hypothetical protein
MNRSLLLVSAAIAAFAIACSTSASDDAASSNDALSGSLASAKACAVRDAYAAAELSAFKSAAKTELPGVQQSGSSSLSKFDVKDVGNVFVVEDGATMSFYDANGTLLAKASTAAAELSWTQPNNTPLSCAAPSAPGVDGGPSTPGFDSGAPAPTSCLATDPIDATQFTYNPPTPAAAGKCTSQELSTISSYYTQHAAEQPFNLDGWKASVSAGCSSCAFGDVNAATWAPILLGSDGQLDVISGGCIGTVSHNADCGRAYQQYQDCTLTACLAKCTTQEDFSACRADQAVLTTSCKKAVDDVLTVCGQDKLGEYQTACQGTTYTFEGPIKVMCVTGQ